jgi:DNA-binding response OmpR family regulator
MKTVLLVEDDPFLIDIYFTKLKEAGFKPEVAKDGNTALKMIKEKKPDLLLLDIVLPHIDGWEILKALNKEGLVDHLKIVILSNLGQKSEVERGIKLGATKYLIKSDYTPSEVIEEIKKIL